MKKCTTCKEEKPLSEFSNNKSRKDGKHSQCKACNKIQAAEYRAANKDKLKAKRKAKYWKDVESSKAKCREQYLKHKDRKQAQNKRWKDANPERYKEIHRAWYLKNRERKLKQNRLNEKRYLSTDPMFRVKKNLRHRLHRILTKKANVGDMVDLIGCSVSDLKVHLEKSFYGDIGWDNYGSHWHVDHIKPCSLFDLTDLKQRKECFHYSNLQPLTIKDNLSKSNKYEDLLNNAQ